MQTYFHALLTEYKGKTEKYSDITHITFFDSKEEAINSAKGAFFFCNPGEKAVVAHRPESSIAVVDAEIVWSEAGLDIGKKISEIVSV